MIFSDPSKNLETLRNNTYPGRGIILGIDSLGQNAIQLYWVMGRSENSKNRILVLDGETVKTKAFDESKVSDPSLIIYNAMSILGANHIVSNGDQTDTIYHFLSEGKTFEDALKTREFEPDSPNFTPRISGLFNSEKKQFLLSAILRNQETGVADHKFFNFTNIENGTGFCVHTYESDGNPIPSFRSNPYSLPLTGDINEIADNYWKVLNEDNKVGLVLKFINLKNNDSSYRIVNKLS